MIKNKCYGCEKRTVGCHSTCEDYKEYRDKLDKENDARKKERAYEQLTQWAYVHKRKTK